MVWLYVGNMLRIITTVCYLALLVSGDLVRHDGHKAVRITADTEEKMALLQTLRADVDLDVWREVRGQLDVMVSPHRLPQLEQQLEEAGLSWTTLVEDVQQLIDSVEIPKTPRDFYNYSDFNSYEDIQRELRVMADQCAFHSVFDDLFCTVDTLSPDTMHGRTIQVLRVRRPGADRQIIYMDSLTHAREWLGGTTLMNIANDIVHGRTQSGIDYLQDYDFYFNPIVNPDGYTYSWTGDRTWRKNGRPDVELNCTGVDINRNFQYDWGMEPGSSGESCSETYRGSSAVSENEAQAVQADLMAHSHNILTYISIHCYGQVWYTSYGSQTAPGVCKLPDTYFDCQRTAAQFAAMGTANAYGNPWDFGSVCSLGTDATGITIDTATGLEDITFSFSPELRGEDNDGNYYAFYAPPSEIPYAYSETWQGIISLLVQIEQLVSTGACVA